MSAIFDVWGFDCVELKWDKGWLFITCEGASAVFQHLAGVLKPTPKPFEVFEVDPPHKATQDKNDPHLFPSSALYWKHARVSPKQSICMCIIDRDRIMGALEERISID